MRHRYGDQYARLEAIRSYLQMAGSILVEFRKCEKLLDDPELNPDHVDKLAGDIDASSHNVQDLIDSIAAEAAIEGAEKDTLLPPPMHLDELDEPFPATRRTCNEDACYVGYLPPVDG